MKKWWFCFLIVAIASLLFAACSQDKGAYKISKEGGLIQAPELGVSLAIEANAVDKDVGLDIVPMNTPTLMGDDQVTDFIAFNGLEAVNGMVICTIDVSTPLSGDTYAAVTVPAYLKSEGVTVDTIVYLPCKVKDNKVSFEIPMDDIDIQLNEQSLWDKFVNVTYADNNIPHIRAAIITGQTTTKTQDGKFKVIAGSDVKPIQRETVEEYLKFVYNFYHTQLGFKKLEDYSRYPISVTIRGLYPVVEGDIYGNGAAGYFYDVGPIERIVINKQLLSKFDEIQRTVIHEFFHFTQSLYADKEWFDEATAVWVEERYKPNSAYIPDLYKKFGGEQSQIMDGPSNTLGRSERNHGYGSAAFIKYLVDHQNAATKLVSVYENMPADEVAILNAIKPIETWNNDFYVKLLGQEIYGGTVPNLVTYKNESKGIKMSVKEDSDPEKDPIKEVIEIPPYGARAIYVAIDFGDVEKVNKNLSVVASAAAPDVTMNWMVALGKDMSPLASGKDELPLALKDLATKKHFLGLVVTNQTNNVIETDIDFKIKNIPPLDELVGDWTDASAFFEDIWLHPEIQKIIDNPPKEDEAPPEGLTDEFGEGCEMMTAEMIYEMFKQLAEMEGKTFPAKLTITQSSETTGSFGLAMDTGDGMDESGLPVEFEYTDGIMKAEIVQAEEGAEAKITLEIAYMYDSDDNIIANGYMDLDWGSEGKTAMKFHILVNGKRPKPAESK